MTPELKVIIFEEKNIISKLLKLLDDQYEFLIEKDIIKIDNISKKLDEVSKELARAEIKRRSIMGNQTDFKMLIDTCEDENIKECYKEIKDTLNMIENQKQANEMLIKQKLFFTKKMMNCIKPNKGIGTYNSYGQVGK